MSRSVLALIFYGVGIAAILFSTIRTFYLIWKNNKSAEKKRTIN